MLEDFSSNYLQLGEENEKFFKIEQKPLKDSTFFAPFLGSVKRLYNAIPQSNIFFNCDFTHADSGLSLIVDINIDDQNVNIQNFGIDSDVELSNIFRDTELVNALEDWSKYYVAKKIKSIELLTALIDHCFRTEENIDITITFSFDKSGIISQLPIEIPDDFNTITFLSFANFEKHFRLTPPHKLKDFLLSGKIGTLLLIQGAPSNCLGDYFGLLNLADTIANTKIVDNFLANSKKDLKNNTRRITETISSINLDFFLPPQFFNFLRSPGCDESLNSLFYPSLFFNLLISFSDFVERINDDHYKLTINGKRIVNGEIKFTPNRPSQFQLDGEIIDYANYSKQIDQLYTFNLKMFGTMDTGELDGTKILLSKKVISIYSRNYLNFLEHINDIINSTQSDYQLYIHEKIDKFINVKEQLANYTFNQNKEIIKFSSSLSETLSTTFFRIAGLILVFLIGFVTKTNDASGDKYLFYGPLLLILFIVFSLYRICNINTLYIKNKEHHELHMEYFSKYLDEKDIAGLAKTIDNSIFTSWYRFSVAILVLIIVLCFGAWIFLNFYPSHWLNNISMIILNKNLTM